MGWCMKPIPKDASVCWACEWFVKRVTSETDIVPQGYEKCLKYYAVEGCGEVLCTCTSTIIARYDIAREHLDLVQSADCNSSPLALCNPHYQQLCGAIRFPVPCMCSMCVTAHGVVEITLNDVQTPFKSWHTCSRQWRFDGILSGDLKVWKPCSDFHSLVLQQQNPGQVNRHLFLLCMHDIEYQLEREIVKYEISNHEVITDKEYLGWIVCKVALQLVKTFQQHEAILLPEVHPDFAVWLVYLKNTFQMCKSCYKQSHLQAKALELTQQPSSRKLCHSVPTQKVWYTSVQKGMWTNWKHLQNLSGIQKDPVKLQHIYSRQECSSVFSANSGQGEPTDVTDATILHAIPTFHHGIKAPLFCSFNSHWSRGL